MRAIVSKSPSSFGRLAQDIFDLCELQLQLLSVDSEEAKRRAIHAVILVAIGATLAGSALTTAMIGGGFLLSEVADWTVGASLLTVAGCIIGFVIVLFIAANRAVRAASAAMQETKSEFVENVKWIKAVLRSPQSSPRNQEHAASFARSSNSPMDGNQRQPNEPVFNER